MRGRREPLALPIFSLLAALSGGACDASIDPITVPEGCPQQPLRGPAEYANATGDRLIDDFEDGDDKLARVANRNGTWFWATNGSSNTFAVGASSQCAARGQRAGRYYVAGFTERGTNWTAVFLPPFPTGFAAPLNAEDYSGISFWAALGSHGTEPHSQGVGVTTLDNAWNGNVCAGGDCMDYYAAQIRLTKSWQRYVIKFADLAQKGFGEPLVPLNVEQLVGFIIWPAWDLDMWIDDIRFEP